MAYQYCSKNTFQTQIIVRVPLFSWSLFNLQSALVRAVIEAIFDPLSRALVYNTTPHPICQHFFSEKFDFFEVFRFVFTVLMLSVENSTFQLQDVFILPYSCNFQQRIALFAPTDRIKSVKKF